MFLNNTAPSSIYADNAFLRLFMSQRDWEHFSNILDPDFYAMYEGLVVEYENFLKFASIPDQEAETKLKANGLEFKVILRGPLYKNFVEKKKKMVHAAPSVCTCGQYTWLAYVQIKAGSVADSQPYCIACGLLIYYQSLWKEKLWGEPLESGLRQIGGESFSDFEQFSSPRIDPTFDADLLVFSCTAGKVCLTLHLPHVKRTMEIESSHSFLLWGVRRWYVPWSIQGEKGSCFQIIKFRKKEDFSARSEVWNEKGGDDLFPMQFRNNFLFSLRFPKACVKDWCETDGCEQWIEPNLPTENDTETVNEQTQPQLKKKRFRIDPVRWDGVWLKERDSTATTLYKLERCEKFKTFFFMKKGYTNGVLHCEKNFLQALNLATTKFAPYGDYLHCTQNLWVVFKVPLALLWKFYHVQLRDGEHYPGQPGLWKWLFDLCAQNKVWCFRGIQASGIAVVSSPIMAIKGELFFFPHAVFSLMR